MRVVLGFPVGGVGGFWVLRGKGFESLLKLYGFRVELVSLWAFESLKCELKPRTATLTTEYSRGKQPRDSSKAGRQDKQSAP